MSVVTFPAKAPARDEKRRIFTDQSIRGLKAPTSGGSVAHFVDDTPGLALRITSAGARTWTLYYRWRGAQKVLSLGRYPALKLADARDLAREAERQRSKGIDPAAVRQASQNVLTFGKLAEKYMELYAAGKRESGRKEEQRKLNADILPRWKNRPAAEITRRDVAELIAEKAKTAPIAGNRLRSLLSKLYAFAVEHGFVEHSPVFGTKRPGKEKRRERVLTEDEIRRVWAACDTQVPRVAAWFRLRLVTAQRGGELLQMRWKDLDGDWWTIPGEFTKNGKAHRVYLSETAGAILDGLHRKQGATWVFPLDVMGDHKHVGRRLAQSTRANIVKDGDPVPPRGRATADFTGHDMRRTAATFMARAGVPENIIGRILNHSQSKNITDVYVRASFDREKKAAMEVWDQQLAAILAGKPAESADRYVAP